MELKCEKCERSFDQRYSLGQHKRYCKGIKFAISDLQMKYDSGLTLTELSDKYKLSRNYLAININCRTLSESNKLAHKKFPESFKHSEETKEKQRQSRFNYLKLKTGNTPWDKRQRGEMSYLENWFKEEVILKYSLQEKYDIVYNYAEYPYFLDFAFINVKLAVELDGKCHFKNGHERIQHDIERDKKLIEKGWIVYRIRYDEINEKTINDFLVFLHNIKNIEAKVYGNNLYKYCEISKEKKTNENKLYIFYNNLKKIIYPNNKLIKLNYKGRTRKQFFIERKNDYKNTQIKYVDLILKSEIDFSKIGWVNPVSVIINQKPQKVNIWMKKMMPDFYKNCFKRK